MPFNDPIMSAAFFVVSSAWAWWIARSIQPDAEFDRGQCIVRYGRGIRALAVVGWLGAIALTVVACVEPSFPPWFRVALPICGFFLATVVHLEFFYAQVRYDRAGVHVVSPWKADRVIPWAEFHSVSYSDWSDAYVLQSTLEKDVSLHKYMSGIDALLVELAERGVPIEIDK